MRCEIGGQDKPVCAGHFLVHNGEIPLAARPFDCNERTPVSPHDEVGVLNGTQNVVVMSCQVVVALHNVKPSLLRESYRNTASRNNDIHWRTQTSTDGEKDGTPGQERSIVSIFQNPADRMRVGVVGYHPDQRLVNLRLAGIQDN